MQSKFCVTVPYLADTFKNKLKTKVPYRTVSNKRRIHNSFRRNFPIIAKQMPSKVLFVGKKTRRLFGNLGLKILIVGSSK